MPDYSPPFLGNVSLNVKGLVEFDLYKSTFSPKEKKNIFSFFALKKILLFWAFKYRRLPDANPFTKHYLSNYTKLQIRGKEKKS